MTLADLQLILQDNLRDPTKVFMTDARCLRFINQAMHHVANLIASQKPNLMQSTHSVVTAGVSAGGIEIASMSGATFTRVKSILYATVAATTPLQLVEFSQVRTHLKAALTGTPRIAEYNNTFAILEPSAGLTIAIWYTFGLNDMTTGTDTPGQAGGAGAANAIPPEYHPLIADFATMEALGAAGRDPGAWTGVYQSRAQALGLDLTTRRKNQQ